MLLMIDNYDSFTYNLVQYLRALQVQVQVVRNDHITLAEMERLRPSHLVISPGPCAPDQAGICLQAISHFLGRLPILGVCLGHQAIGQALGGRIVRARELMHGKLSRIHHDAKGVFQGLPPAFEVVRYHSLAIESHTLPAELEVSATSPDGEIMAVRHRQLAGTATPIEGVQFHPESILSEHGMAVLANFVRLGASA